MILEKNVIHNIDCVEGMKQLEDETIDLVFCDPPFALDFFSEKHESMNNRKKDNILPGYNEIKENEYYDFMLLWLEQAFRILKPTGTLGFTNAFNHLDLSISAMKQVGLKFQNQIIWTYPQAKNTYRKFNTNHTNILIGVKEPKLAKFYPYSRHSFQERIQMDGYQKKAHFVDKHSVWEIKKEKFQGCIKTPTMIPLELTRHTN